MAVHPAALFGLFATLSNVSIPLISVNYGVNVKSFAGHITINQTYKNVESTDLECVYGFPINDQAAIVGLIVTIGNRTLTSQFKKKEDAFKEYTEALARNDGAYLLDQSDRSDDTFVLSVGRLPPGKECIVSISYVNTLESVTETKMRLTIPTSLYPRYNPNPSAPTGIAPPEKYQANVSYKATLSGHIDAIDVILNLTSPTHPLNVTSLGPKESVFKFAGEQAALDRDLFIDIEIKDNPQYYVEVERLPDGKYTAMFAFVPQFRQGAVNTEIIFVVDCSGSMTDDDRIGYAKKTMQIFLRSIPEGSYFNFYRFGSTYESLFNQSEIYSASSFGKAKEYAEKTEANLGGTEILSSLQKIYSEPARAGFSRQIFILTDGEVTNTQEVISLVRENAGNTRVFAFGLGNSPSRSLVNGIAAAGNGKAEFIKDGLELDSIVARQVNRALKPAVTDAQLTWTGVANVEQVPKNLPAIFKGDRQIVYAFFDATEETTDEARYITIQRGATRTKIPIVIPSTEEKATETPFLNKLAARELIKQVENSGQARYGYQGSLQSRAQPLTDEQIKEKVTALSIRHGVLSKYVSLVAVENRSAEEKANGTQAMTLREVPVQKAEQPSSRRYSGGITGGSRGWGGRGGGRGSGGGRGGGSRTSYSSGSRYGSAGVASSGRTYYSSSNSGAVFNSFSGARWAGLATTRYPWAHGTQEEVTSSSASAVSTTVNPATKLSQLLALQQWNGAWIFSPELQQLTNISRADAVAAVAPVRTGLSDDVVSTVMVAAFIESEFPEKAEVWEAIISKASAFLAKQSDSAAVVSVKAVLLDLIKAK